MCFFCKASSPGGCNKATFKQMLPPNPSSEWNPATPFCSNDGFFTSRAGSEVGVLVRDLRPGGRLHLEQARTSGELVVRRVGGARSLQNPCLTLRLFAWIFGRQHVLVETVDVVLDPQKIGDSRWHHCFVCKYGDD